MSSVKNVLSWGKEITYKPNVDLTFESRGPRDPYVTMHMSRFGPDANDPTKSIVTTQKDMIEIKMLSTRGAFLSWVYRNILKFEMHEMDEWLKASGEKLRDPHKNDAYPRHYENS